MKTVRILKNEWWLIKHHLRLFILDS
jgi:hypothetical protein